jgi:mannose-1-phosphate guanylyltransferase
MGWREKAVAKEGYLTRVDAGVGVCESLRNGHAQSTRVHGVVLAGVHAWGDCVLERAVSRPLVPVANRPLIWYTLRWLRQAGVGEASICANSDTSVLQHCLGDGEALDIELDYYEDVMPRGPAGCARDAVDGGASDGYVVVDGTIVPSIDLDAMLAEHQRSGAALTVAAAPERGREDDPEAALEPVGIYIFSREAIGQVPATGYQDIKEALIPRLYKRGQRIVPFVVRSGAAPRVVNAASYLTVSKWAVCQLAGGSEEPDGYVRQGEALVHQSAGLHASVRVIGPVMVGPRSTVAEGSLLIGPTTVGADCTLGRATVVSRSVLWSGCTVGAGAVLDHTVLTDDADAEPGVVLRNTVIVPDATRAAAQRNGTRPPGLARRLASLWRAPGPVGRNRGTN